MPNKWISSTTIQIGILTLVRTGCLEVIWVIIDQWHLAKENSDKKLSKMLINSELQIDTENRTQGEGINHSLKFYKEDCKYHHHMIDQLLYFE